MRNRRSNGYQISHEELEELLVQFDVEMAGLAANQNGEPAPAPRQSITIADWCRHAEVHGVPLWAAANELHRAAAAVTEPTPELDVPCDLRSGDPEPLPAARTSVNSRPRRSGARDWRSAATTARYHLAELEARGRALVRDRTFSHTHDYTPPKSTTKTLPKAANENVAAWKDTKALGKIIAANRAVELDETAEAWAWTLNLSPAVIARGIASPQGFAAWLLKRIQRELAKAFPYREPFAITLMVDVTRTGRPHAHGLIAMDDNERPAVEAALRRAGGSWAAACSDRQVDTRPAWNADGWSSYGTRNMAAAKKVVGNGVFAASASVKRDAKSLHERLRKLANAA